MVEQNKQQYVWGENVVRLVCWTSISENKKEILGYREIIPNKTLLAIQKDGKNLIGKVISVEIGDNPHINLEMSNSKKGKIYCNLEKAPIWPESFIPYELVIDDGITEFKIIN